MYSQRTQNDKLSKQSNLFTNFDELNFSKSFVKTSEWSINECEENEFSSIGYYLSSHPLKKFKSIYNRMNLKNTNYFNKLSNFDQKSKILKTIGIVKSIFKRKSQSGNFYGVIEINDFEGVIEIFIDDYNLRFLEESYKNNEIFFFHVELRSDDNFGYRIICKGVFSFYDILSKETFDIEIYINELYAFKYLKKVVSEQKKGTSNLNLVVNLEDKKLTIDLNHKIKFTSDFLRELTKISGISNFNLI